MLVSFTVIKGFSIVHVKISFLITYKQVRILLTILIILYSCIYL